MELCKRCSMTMQVSYRQAREKEEKIAANKKQEQ
jgi:hypothetical protein